LGQLLTLQHAAELLGEQVSHEIISEEEPVSEGEHVADLAAERTKRELAIEATERD
jgi:hypothetical protein